MKQSFIGHVVVLAVFAVALAISQWVSPTKPDEILMDVSLLLGPPTKGEFGAPDSDAQTDQNENKAGGAKPEPPPPAPAPVIKTPPPITEVPVPQPPKESTEAKIPEKETPPVKPPPKPVTPKPPEPAPPKTPTNKVVQAEKPQKHEVKVSKEIVSVATPKNTTPNKLGPAKTTLSAAQIKQIMGLDLPKSPGGGAGFRGGGPPGSVERGALGNSMELYKSALKAKLYNAWTRPAGVDGLRAVIRISIARDGRFVSATLIKRSGSEQMDSSAMQAVRSVSPAPLPDGVTAPYTIEIEFDASGVSV